MSRTTVRLIQQALEGLTVSAGGGGGGNQSEMLSAVSNSSITEITVLAGPVDVFGVAISNQSGSTVEIIWADSTSTNVLHMGSIPNNGYKSFVFSQNFVTFATDVRIKKNNTGNVRWTVLYQ